MYIYKSVTIIIIIIIIKYYILILVVQMHFIDAPSKLLEALNPFAPFKRISPPSNSHLLIFSSPYFFRSLPTPLQTPPLLKKKN